MVEIFGSGQSADNFLDKVSKLLLGWIKFGSVRQSVDTFWTTCLACVALPAVVRALPTYSTCASEGAKRSERSERSVATERVHGEM
uniref:Uncharacterized protein n=1 Tax=Globodera rostochiensis TaxID=31243 RepID=A0A914I9Z3_GLORO